MTAAAREVKLIIDGVQVAGVEGQTIAGVLLAAGRRSWRTTAGGRRPRGLFCGIGVCFDCLVTVNGVPDVRACRRAARDGDVVEIQADELPVAGTSKGGSR